MGIKGKPLTLEEATEGIFSLVTETLARALDGADIYILCAGRMHRRQLFNYFRRTLRGRNSITYTYTFFHPTITLIASRCKITFWLATKANLAGVYYD